LESLQKQQQQHQQRNNRDRDRDRDENGNVGRQLAGHNGNGIANGNGGHRSSGGQVSHRPRANVAGVAATLQGSERISSGGGGGAGGSIGAGGDQHTALMDEFKRAVTPWTKSCSTFHTLQVGGSSSNSNNKSRSCNSNSNTSNSNSNTSNRCVGILAK